MAAIVGDEHGSMERNQLEHGRKDPKVLDLKMCRYGVANAIE